MISLEFRKIVDTAGWDQSFVDPCDTTRGGLTRVSSGTEEAVGAKRFPRFAFEDPEAVDREVPLDSKAYSEAGASRHVTANGTVLTPVRSETIVGAVNPFLGPGRRFATEVQPKGDFIASPKAPNPGFRQSGRGTSPETVHDLDLRGRRPGSRNGVPPSDVTSWLESLEPFDSSRFLRNSSTSSSPSATCDDTGSRSTVFDDRTPDSTDRRGTPVAWPPHYEGPLGAYSRAASFLPAWDDDRLRTVYARLRTSGFYLGRMSMDEARRRLAAFPVGTFLLRDSSDPRFRFSLSVQTRRGTTSIRILYESGHFRMDSEPDQVHLMPTFGCVLALIGHYIRRGSGRPPWSDSTPNGGYVFRETTGRRDTPVLLRRPLETTPASLAHLCRRRIHRSLGCSPSNITRLHLKPSLKDYLAEYPYDI